MNILYSAQFSMKNIASWSVHCYEVVSGLSRLGHNIVFIDGTCFVPGPVDNVETQPLQPSLWMRLENRLGWFRILRPIKPEITILWLLLREVKTFLTAFITIIRWRGKFDVIYERHLPLSCQYLLAKLFRICSVKEVNGIGVDEIRVMGLGSSISLRVMDWIDHFNIPRADKIIVVTSKLKEVLQEEYKVPGEKIVVVTNGANTDLFKPIDTTISREKLNLNQSNSYVCFVGAFYVWQGLEYLIRSAPLILRECPETRFLMVGDGMEKQRLINLAGQFGVSDKIVFTGMVPYQEVPLYINAADICVLPKVVAKSGLSPLKLYEYLACGKPVVSSRVSGLDILEETNSGLLVEPEDSQELAHAIIMLLENQELRRELGSNGRRYVVENQSWESVARKVAKVCQDVVDSKRN